MTDAEDELLEGADAALVAELRAKHDDIAYWAVPRFGLVVAAAPENPKEYHRLVNDLKNDKIDSAVALETFALACVVHPTREEAKRIFRAKPAFALKVAGRGQRLCGSDIQELGKD
jgi:hypothetical protein